MTIAEAVYDIKEALKDYSDDSELSFEYITHLINTKRAKYLKQRLSKVNANFNTSLTQTLCLDMNEVSANECGLDNVECDKILRSNKKLPNQLQLTLKSAILKVSPSNKLSKNFNLISKSKAVYFLNSNFKNKIKAFIDDDNYIYLISSEPILLDCISVTAIFENPMDLSNYKNCCNCDNLNSNNCFDIYNTEYPIQIDLFEDIRKDLITELINRNRLNKEDKINNSQDD